MMQDKVIDALIDRTGQTLKATVDVLMARIQNAINVMQPSSYNPLVNEPRAYYRKPVTEEVENEVKKSIEKSISNFENECNVYLYYLKQDLEFYGVLRMDVEVETVGSIPEDEEDV